MFQLRRLDVWPTGDLGVRKGLRTGLGDPDADGQGAGTRSGTPSAPTARWWRGTAGGPAELYAGAADSAHDPIGGMKTLLVVHHTVSPATHALHLAAARRGQRPGHRGGRRGGPPGVDRGAGGGPGGGRLPARQPGQPRLSLRAPSSTSSTRSTTRAWTPRNGRPFGVYLHANNDATGALRALDAITTGLGWRAAQAPLVVAGEPVPGRPGWGPGARRGVGGGVDPRRLSGR